jgi:hypothetical protein
MAIEANIRIRFDRVIYAIRGLIDSLIAQEVAWEDLKKGKVGVYADSAMACSNARQAFEDETPTMEALAITLRDDCYKDPTWPADGTDDVKLLRMAWQAIHKIIETGKSFTPDDLGVMQNLCAAIERAREKLTSIQIHDSVRKPSWDRNKGELSFDGEVIKKIRRIGNAINVVLLLDTFQELGWPDRVDSPLSPEDSQKHHATIRSLNTSLSRIRFRSDGEGIGFIWESLPAL